MRVRGVLMLPLVAILTNGCAFGPRMLERTYGQYAASVQRVEEEQLLRQIVLARYNESAVSLDITTIAAQYEASANAEGRPFFSAETSSGIFHTFGAFLPFLSATASNRPTMTFVPRDEGSTVRRSLTPIPLDTLIFLTQSGWPVSTTFRLWVDRLGGIPNGAPVNDPPRECGQFLHIIELLQSAQDRELAAVHTEQSQTSVGGPFPAEAVNATSAVEAAKAGFQYVPARDGKAWNLVRNERKLVVAVSPGAESHPEILEIEKLLNLVPGRRSYDVTVSASRAPDPAKFTVAPTAELQLTTRSQSQVVRYLAHGVEVPADHACRGLDAASTAAGDVPLRNLFAVRSCNGHRPPECAWLAVKYRGYWYYIADSDTQTKATFALVLQLSRLDFARQYPGGATLTLPVGR